MIKGRQTLPVRHSVLSPELLMTYDDARWACPVIPTCTRFKFMIHLTYCLCSFRGCTQVHTLIITLLIIVSIALIVVVLLQSGKSAGLSGAISGGAEQLFGKQKARGMDLVLQRITVVLSVLFFILTILVTIFEV